ncbi:MAG: carboxypeptidase-like regulatory domain-containing protein [Acidobacteriia bacterium]|nr:carboxypeptidase-like regulatory domain-containing protein [Terriglobia bacterium]
MSQHNGCVANRFRAVCLLALVPSYCIVVFAPGAAAQSSTSGTIVGTVSDPTGAMVPKAEVQLLNVGTNAMQTQLTNESGGYVFPNVMPGTYQITVKLAGFRTAEVSGVVVEVNRSVPMPIRLEVGGDKEVVEVSATATAQLQTVDAQIGNALTTDSILRLPTLQRNVTELMNLQPGVVAGGNGLQMRVSGAIDDQNTVTLDGVDITQNVVATGTSVPTPADSVEEFRVTTANPDANFERASGGQMTLIGRHGSNAFHGALYEYLQNSALNSNTWDNNHAGIKKAAIRDNRFGARVGGPVLKDKTFFFANFEGRRFASIAQVQRTVPTATLKQGIVEFRDPSGNIQQFNLATAAVCGPNGNSACDPRGLGMSPSVKAQWALMPLPNLSGGDGLNTGAYLANIPTPIQTDYGVMRLDHNFSNKLTFNGSYTYFRSITTGSGDISIVNGQPQSVIQTPQRGLLISGALTWQIQPTLINVFRFGFVRDNSPSAATSPTVAAGQLNIPGTSTSAGPIALLIGSGTSAFLDSPIDMDTQRARYQAAYSQDRQFIDDMTKIRGKHTIQFGTNIDQIPFTHVRADKVVGSISSLVANIDGNASGDFLNIPSLNSPLTCGGSVTSNCLKSSDLTNWGRYYASMLGLIDNINVLAVRDANLNPVPFGTNLVNHTMEYATYFYIQDSWRVKPNLTLTYGLSYGWQTAPTEKNNLQTVMLDATTNQLIDPNKFLQTKMQMALQGQVYNPTVGYAPVNLAHVPVYNIDWGNLGPRAAFAWSPSGHNGFLNRLLGDRKTSIRGGFGLIYDRSNTVQAVEIPMLGVGFDQTINIQTPACNLTGAGGPGCNASAGTANPGLSNFRVGVDGTLPLPTPSKVTSPVIPATNFGETLSFQVDPFTKIGRSYNVDLSVQRELPGNMIVEFDYVGRTARHLPQAVNLTSSPYMFVDKASGQSFAQAYDNIASALRAGQTPAAQPWFENQLPGLAALKGFNGTATAYLISQQRSNIVNASVSNLFSTLGTYRRQLGLPLYNNDQAQMEFLRTYIGQSNYQAGIVTLTKRLSRGLTVRANYTYSKALDDGLSNQNNAGFYGNSFHPGVDYGPSSYDRRHVFNADYVYDLPIGKGHMLSTRNFVDKIIGGWYTSGIITAWSGLPLTVTENAPAFGGGLQLSPSTAAIFTGPISGVGLNHGVVGTSTGTTAGGANGTGMNLFSNPDAVFQQVRFVNLSSDTRTGKGNPIYGLPFKNMDVSFGKITKITERVTTRFSADFFNVFNHANFNNPGLNLQNQGAFGVITGTYTPPNRTNSARWIEFGLRLEF